MLEKRPSGVFLWEEILLVLDWLRREGRSEALRMVGLAFRISDMVEDGLVHSLRGW